MFLCVLVAAVYYTMVQFLHRPEVVRKITVGFIWIVFLDLVAKHIKLQEKVNIQTVYCRVEF